MTYKLYCMAVVNWTVLYYVLDSASNQSGTWLQIIIVSQQVYNNVEKEIRYVREISCR